MKKGLALVYLSITSLFMLACSVEGEVTDSTQRTKSPFVGDLTGLDSGASQNVITETGYSISSTIGGPLSASLVSSGSNYKIFSTVQGNISAGDTTKVIVNE